MPHIYTSAKGEFVPFDMWVRNTGNDMDEVHHNSPVDTPEKIAVYKRWIEAEQITSHKFIDENGNETVFPL